MFSICRFIFCFVLQFPLFQTFGMFTGMTAALVMHFIVLKFEIPFPGYVHATRNGYNAIEGEGGQPPVPTWMYFVLIIPSVFDLVATALCMFGLLHVNVSIYQMLRGSAIIFVAILKEFVLKDKLRKYMWVGVFWNVVSIVLVGMTALFSASDDASGPQNPLLGVMLILSGALVQSLQYAFEERVMSMDVAAPPLLLIGMEGLWGTLLCIFVLYPIAYYTPGDDHGSYENPFNTFYMLKNSSEVQNMFFLYFICIFAYNMLACLVTFMLNSVWHAILDNFRPITVWVTDLVIFYCISTAFGESWTVWSFLQLLGMGVLLYGTAVYNAPNAGSIKLTGTLYDCFFDFSEEYDEAEADARRAAASGEEIHPVLATMSPFMSPRTKMMSPRSRAGQGAGSTGYGTDDGGFSMQSMKVKQSSFA
jgi:drug/metabolite transporter (DMT)-like permease